MDPSVPSEYPSYSPDPLLSLMLGRNIVIQNFAMRVTPQTSRQAPKILRIGVHAKPSEVIDDQRADESCCDRDTHKRAGTDFVHKLETGIELDCSNQPADNCPPGNRGQVLGCRQRVRHDEERPVKKKVMSANDIAEASQGFTTDLFS